MKSSYFKQFGWGLMLASVLMFVACSDDDPVIDTGDGDVQVADGLYITVDGENPSGSALLAAESVEDEGFKSQTRSGFVGGYVWLDAGAYKVVQVTDKTITATFGAGGSEDVTDAASDCDYNDYTVISTVADGDAVNVATAGLYRVTHDQMTNELVVYEIKEAVIRGSATAGGWGADTEIPNVSLTADGGKWEQEGVVLRDGEWKIRLNCRWSVDRRVDPGMGFDPANGYQFFTNFGGSVNDLQNGNDGPNIQQMGDGTYTVTIEWSPRNGWTANALRTGDAPVLTFDPNDFKWGIIGDATAGEWSNERFFLYKLEGTTHEWHGVATLAGTGNFKFRADPDWNTNIGGTLAPDGVATTLDLAGSDIPTPGEGDYYFKISTDDEGATWQVTMSPNGWSIIGEGGPAGAWDVDTYLDAQPFSGGISTYTYTGDFTTGGWKFRAGGDWALNLGDNLGGLVLNGGNLQLGEAGTYLITMSYDGSVWSATAEKQ